MSITITDPLLLSQFRAATGVVDIRDPDGRLIGELSVVELGKLPPGVRSPFSDADREAMSKNRTGRPLKDIMRDLEDRG